MSIIPNIIERHTEEAADLWMRRQHVAGAPHYDLNMLADLDDRIDAHLDGLRVAPGAGWEFARNALEDAAGPGETFTATVLALESRDEDRLHAVLSVATTTPALVRAAASAFEWASSAIVEQPTRLLLRKDCPRLRRLGLAAASGRRQAVLHALDRALNDRDPALRSLALKVTGVMGHTNFLSRLRANLDHEDEECRWAAASSAVRLAGDEEAIRVLEDFAARPGRRGRQAAELVVRRMKPRQALTWLNSLLAHSTAIRSALAGFAALGCVPSVPCLLEAMKKPALARCAFEAFCTITGASPDSEELSARPPECFDGGPSDDPTDPNVDIDPDEHLPWPDPDRVKAWWSARSGSFFPEERYLLGKPASAEWMRAVLRSGWQRHRIAAALELALLDPKKPLFNVRMPAWRQRKLLDSVGYYG